MDRDIRKLFSDETEETSVGRKKHELPWYDLNLVLQDDARELLEKYSHIEPSKVEGHILAIRDKAWQVFPYPCVGEFGFLDLNLCQRAAYQRILCKLKAHPGARHLDVGCCVGQDIRRLVYDGVPSSQIVGLELERGFVELGYDLFLDNPETLHTQFVIGNMLDDGNAELNALEGTFDTFHVGLVLHLFNLQEQVKFLKRIMKLSKRDTTVLVVGHCIGHVDGVEVTSTRGELTMRHNLETWEKLWHQVSEETGTKWKLRTDMDDLVGFGPRHTKWRDPERRRILFEAERE